MKDHINKLISELKSTKCIIKLLQEDILLSSPRPKSQANLTGHVGQNTQVVLHRNNEESYSWKEVCRNRAETARNKKNVQTAQLGTDPFPPLTNRYDPLCKFSNSDDTPDFPLASTKTKPKHTERQKLNKKKRVPKKVKNKVMIFGDSHARGCAAELGHLLQKDFEVMGSVTPGSGMRHIKNASSGIINQLTKEDAVVIWGGSNDIAKNNASTGMKHLLDLVINATHTNIILMSAPHRFDLIETSCVNLEIKNFNSKLRSKLKNIGKVKLIEVDKDRTLFTGHGQHLNARGKENMAKKIASMIKRMLAKETKPIRVKWYLDNETPDTSTPTTNDQVLNHEVASTTYKDSNYDTKEDEEEKDNLSVSPSRSRNVEFEKWPHNDGLVPNDMDTQDLDTDAKRPESPHHRRKCPVRRNPDFLWT